MFALRFIIAFALSTAVCAGIGLQYYAVIAVLVMIVALAFGIANESHHRRGDSKLSLPGDETLERAAIEYLTLFGVAFGIGALWPSVPFAIYFVRP